MKNLQDTLEFYVRMLNNKNDMDSKFHLDEYHKGKIKGREEAIELIESLFQTIHIDHEKLLESGLYKCEIYNSKHVIGIWRIETDD